MSFIIDILVFEKRVFRIVDKTNVGKRLLRRGTSFYMIGNTFKNFFCSRSLSTGGLCSRQSSVIVMTSIT